MYVNKMGQRLLTYLSQMEYSTLFSWTSPLPFWVNIFTDQDLCAFVKTVSFKNIFPASQELEKKTEKNDFDPSWVQFLDGVVCMVLGNCFGILHFLIHFICDYGNTQIG